MKRPLVWIGILWILIAAVMARLGGSGEDPAPALALETLLEAADAGGAVTVSGKVAQCRALSDGTQISIDHISIQKSNEIISIRSELKLIFTTEEELAPGDRVWINGTLREFSSATNPGQFDARAWYFSQNTIASLQKSEILQQEPGGISVARVLYRIRSAFLDSYQKLLGEKPARIISAITLGERGLLDQEWKTVYQEGGIAHILAVSGLHITLIGMGLYRLLRRAGAGFGVSALLGGSVVCLYALLCGFGVSAVRATVMFFLWLGAQICGRKYDMVTAAFLAAVLLVTADGDNLTQAAFLLSFGAILSLGILQPQLEEVFGQTRLPFDGLLTGLSISLGTLPISLYFYYQTTPWSVLVNLVVLFLMSSLMLTGLAAAVVGMLWVPAGIFLAAPVAYILDFFDWLCQIEAKLPGGVLVLGRPAIWRIVLYYGILLGLICAGSLCKHTGWLEQIKVWRKRCTGGLPGKGVSGRKQENVVRRLVLSGIWLAGILSCLALMLLRGSRQLTITCMDVGQGDGILLQLPTGENALIDGGSSSKSNLWDNILSQTVKYYGIRRLDYIFLSHADQDHISGIEECLEAYESGWTGDNIHGITIGALVLPPTADEEDFEDLIALARQKGIPILRMQAGDCIYSSSRGEGKAQKSQESSSAGTQDAKEEQNEENTDPGSGEDNPQWSITCLSPDSKALAAEKNQNSMVLRLQYGSFSMLFTGDLEKEAEATLAASGTDLRADILKAGHHGSANATSEAFLAAVQPTFAIISCSENNSYGHPAPATLARLTDAQTQIRQTPSDGAIKIQSDGRTYTVSSYME